MNLALTEEQALLRDSISKLLRTESRRRRAVIWRPCR